MSRNPWPHQIQFRDEVLRAIADGVPSMCVTSPTGSGKSFSTEMTIRELVSQGKRCSLFTSRKLLTTQLCRGLKDSGIPFGVRAAEFEAWTDLDAPVQICSTQTEHARVIKRREKEIRNAKSAEDAYRDYQLFPSDVAFWDEAHINSGEQAASHQKEMRERYGTIHVGITATPIGISHLYGKLIVAGNNSELRKCGALVPAICYEPCSFDIWKVRKTTQCGACGKRTSSKICENCKHPISQTTGVFGSQSELEDRVKAIWSQHIIAGVWDSWKEHNPDGLPSLGMAPGVKESLGLAMEYHKRGVNACHVSADSLFINGKNYNTSDQKDRDEMIAMSKDGRCPIIFFRYVVREGVDLPWLRVLSLATPIASLAGYLQVVGRVLRASPETGKGAAIVLDHAGNVRLHGSPNLNRDEQWVKYYHEDAEKITSDRQQDLRDPSSSEPEPITCVKCSMVRKSGPKCPGCGFEHPVSVRKVIQESGRLVQIKGDVFPKRKSKMKADTASLWERCYYRCRNAKKPLTFAQARALFVKDNHYWPPEGLPLMPKNRWDWSRHIKAVTPDRLIPKEEKK